MFSRKPSLMMHGDSTTADFLSATNPSEDVYIRWLAEQSVIYHHQITLLPRVRDFKDHISFERSFIERQLLATLPAFDETRIYKSGLRGVVLTMNVLHLDLARNILKHIKRSTQPLLPVEIWTAEGKVPQEIRSLCMEFRVFVTCRDLFDENSLGISSKMLPLSSRFYEACIYAIVFSSFEEVIALDIDAVPIGDLNMMFDNSMYKSTGQIFYSDFWNSNSSEFGETVRPNHVTWKFVGVNFYSSFEGESGIVVMNKHRNWRALNLALHLCRFGQLMMEDPPRGYRGPIVWGDKEIWRLAWMYMRKRFWMGQAVKLGTFESYKSFFFGKTSSFCWVSFGHLSPKSSRQIQFLHQPKSLQLPFLSQLTHGVTSFKCPGDDKESSSRCSTCISPNVFEYDYMSGSLNGNSGTWQLHTCKHGCDTDTLIATYEYTKH